MINKKGFTLIELLLALGILGIVSTVIFSIFITNTNNFERNQKRIEVQQNMRTTVEFMSREAMISKGIYQINGSSEFKTDKIVTIHSIVFNMIKKDNHKYSTFEVNKGDNSALNYGKFLNTTNNVVAYYIKKMTVKLILQDNNVKGMVFTLYTDEKYNIKPVTTSVYFRNMGVER